MDLAIVEHCPTKVNSLNIPRVENNPITHPSHYSTSITPGGTPPSVINRQPIREKFSVPGPGWAKICAFKLTRTQHVSNFIFTTCVAHKKLIQSAQYNLYPIWTTNKPSEVGRQDQSTTQKKGRKLTPGDQDERCSIAHSNQPKKAREIFCNFYDPKRRINSKGQISEQRTPIHTQ